MEIQKFVYRRTEVAGAEPIQLFATPLLEFRLSIATPEFLRRVRAYVLALEAQDKGVKISNVGGWHSSGNLFDAKDDETMRQLGEALLSAAARMSYFHVRDSQPDCSVEAAFQGSWANLSRDGGYNKPHVHPNAMWSGVFYVDLGDGDPEPAENGCIEFMDPRPGNLHGSKRLLRPMAGQALIFPAWLYHYVNPFRGRGERISIAFNVNARTTPLA